MAAKTAIAALFLAAVVAEYATVTVADASTECPYPCLPPPTGVTYYPSPPPPPQQPFPNYYYSPPPPSTPYTPGINVPGVMPYLPAAPPPPSQIVPYFLSTPGIRARRFSGFPRPSSVVSLLWGSSFCSPTAAHRESREGLPEYRRFLYIVPTIVVSG
ncbi:unnamed protein product [Spirodela intermedia]|uniref:Uncharacterized protein n=1 Tax=Spirodela intermedia TaxID=51605 RepID=A0A7I8JMT4_SPIIN|nr:unnamed protein product [Spirodela intermedia]CAA6671410.1 unnamed protein product [Spirodela intermedia]